jgi:hypothetical protein
MLLDIKENLLFTVIRSGCKLANELASLKFSVAEA